MATLTGQSIASTYKDLLQVSNSNSGITTSLTAISDGEGTASGLEISDSFINIASGFKLDGAEIFSSASEINMTSSGNLDVNLTGVSGNHDTLASAKAIKTYADTHDIDGGNF
jgi:hypothetical protein